ncbi:MAG: MFS transporter [Verrucomicrobia bacterium]|nr:MFS transporter [Verrucomicrobiota bacterium]
MITASSIDAAAPKTDSSLNVGYVWLISVVAAMGGLLFGWDWVVIGGAKPFFQRYFELTSESQIGWANSCALIGCLFGALAAGGLSDKFGRKRLLILAALIFAVTSLGNALASNYTVFIAWRIFGGVAIGLASSLSPMYIAEVAPAAIRGRLVAINQLTIVVGILLAQYINWYLVRDLPVGATDDFIRSSWFGQQGWRWMFGLTAAPAALFFIGMFFVPESPRWLAKNGRGDLARAVLEKIGGADYAEKARAEIQSTLATEEIQHVRFTDLLEPKMRKVLVLGVVLAVFPGSVNLVFTVFALGIVDKGGRRPLMLFGSAALAVIYTAMGFCYHSNVQGLPVLLLVLAAIGCYAISLAPVTWVVISEIFPNRIRGAAMAVAVSSLWIACFLLTFTFPILNKELGAAGTFWLYGAICVVGFVFIKFKLPETKGKTLEQIERDLVD